MWTRGHTGIHVYGRSGPGVLRADLVREPEAQKEGGVMEGGDLSHPRALEGDDDKVVWDVRASLFVEEIVSEGNLSVRVAGDDAPALPAGEWPAGKEGRNRITVTEPGWNRRHRDRCLLGQHRGDGLDVVALPRIDVFGDDLADTPVPERAQRLLLALFGEALLDCLVGAPEGTVDRRGRGL